MVELRARDRAGDEAGEIRRARGCRALQAGTRTLILTLSEMGNLGNPAEESVHPLPPLAAGNRLRNEMRNLCEDRLLKVPGGPRGLPDVSQECSGRSSLLAR